MKPVYSGSQRLRADRIVKLVATLLATGIATAGTMTYTYDELGRLKEANQNGQVTVYAYDAAGNRTSTSTPPTGTVQLTGSSYNIPENGGTVSVSVSRTGGNYGNASVAYSTSNGSAVSGGDYTSTSGTFTWTSGDASTKTFSIPILDDGVVESSETLSITLSSPSGVTLGSPSSGTVTIADNDVWVPGSLQLAGSTYSLAENGGSISITVTRTGGSSGAATVNYATSNGTATAGSDYSAASGTLYWTDGEFASKSFTIAVLDDSTYESNETVNITLTGATGASLSSPSTAVLTITENDPAPTGTLQFSPASYSVAENGTSVSLTVTRINGSAGSASVNYATSNGTATAGADFTAASGTLNWSPGDTATKSFSISLLDDSTYEGNEAFYAALSGVTGAGLGSPASATVDITENDSSLPTVPANIRKNPTSGTGRTYTILWDASSGIVDHYELQETDLINGTLTSYETTATSKGWTKPNAQQQYVYRVRACAVSGTSQCSALSDQVFKMVCPTSGCE